MDAHNQALAVLPSTTLAVLPSTTLAFHPIANLFPLIEGKEFEELVADIAAHRVREPIVLYQGKILDGRNRYRAAQIAGVDCPVRAYDGDDPIGLVISLNLKRRHLGTSQRAMIAAQLASLSDGQRADQVQGTSIEAAATQLNVGRASVERARLVYASGDPDLVQAVKSGELSVAGAAEIAKRGLNTGVAMNSYAERGLDLYETPAPATRALLAAETLSGTIWEPACGPGAIVRVLRAAGHRVVATDIQDYGCDDSVGGVDFLAQTYAPEGVELIVTNPPFRWADEFVRRALALAPRVVMLLRLHFLEGQSRSDILESGRLARVHVFRNRLPIYRDGWLGPNTSSQMALAWFVWDREHRGPATISRISWSDEAPGDDEAGAP